MLIHGFSPVNARLLTVYGTAFYAITLINTCCWRADHEILMHDGANRSALIFVDLPDNILTLYRMRVQGHFDVYKWTILRRTSPEVKCLHPTPSSREMCMSNVSNVIYHKFHTAPLSVRSMGKNVNVMLEQGLTL